MKIETVVLDLAKTLLQVHGVNSQGRIVVRRQPRRVDVLLDRRRAECMQAIAPFACSTLSRRASASFYLYSFAAPSHAMRPVR
jgi:hypothetical protein